MEVMIRTSQYPAWQFPPYYGLEVGKGDIGNQDELNYMVVQNLYEQYYNEEQFEEFIDSDGMALTMAALNRGEKVAINENCSIKLVAQ